MIQHEPLQPAEQLVDPPPGGEIESEGMAAAAEGEQAGALLPEPGAIRVLLEACAASRAASFLAVLKTMGQQGTGLLSFGGRGHTLALDFPAGPGIDGLLGRLERLVLDHGGQVYLAKDSRLSAAGFAAMYPRLPEFREILAEIDPEGRMRSDLAVRLAIRRAA